jgi:NADH-quinone oxidoreductase subunit L
MVEAKLISGLIPLLPLLGFAIIALTGKRLSGGITSVIGAGSVFVAFLLSVTLFFQMPKDHPLEIFFFDWISVTGFTSSFSFYIDPLASLMLLNITGIGFLIHVYSIAYMHNDEGFNRFFSYLNLFVFFMLILVMGSNYLLMFIGWEGVGLCSYLLIGFWFKNEAYTDAANKAFIMNRIGDLGMLLGIILIVVNFGSIEYSEVFTNPSAISEGRLTLITLLLFVGAMGKSAQLPLYTWLPDAMAGPTPVSALIHAATMVTAGIYMVARNNILYSLAPVSMHVVMIVGLATAIFAATIAASQNDIKKVLAYSTVSQLGLMFLALGLGAYSTAIFHMTTHAFFKALLFLGAGSVIHSLQGEQDLRNMGGIKKYLPITYATFLIGVLAISGIPPFAGFFSKDEILAKAFEQNAAIWALAVIASLLTAFYMFRLLFLTFFAAPRADANRMHHIHESPAAMSIPLIALAVLSTVGGFIGIPEVFHAPHLLNSFLAPVFAGSAAILPHEPLTHMVEYSLMGIILTLTAATIGFAYMRYVRNNRVPSAEGKELNPLHNLSYRKYFVDELYEAVIVKPLYTVSSLFESIIERLGIDKLVNSFGTLITSSGKTIRVIQSGSIGFYILLMVIGIAALLLFSVILPK